MRKCKVCGGDLKSIGNGLYKCVYCMREFEESDFNSVKTSFTEKRSNEGIDVFENNKNGTAEIKCRFDDLVSSGSGFMFDDNGLVITNAHVVTNKGIPSNDISVRIAGEVVKAVVLTVGDKRDGDGNGVDLAVLKLNTIPSKAKSLKFENFDNVKIGEQVYVIGNSLGDGTCITSGIVSDKCRVMNGKRLLMTDCAINGGNSGGPIFNCQGLVIGVIVSSRIKEDGSAAEGMNYAIPISTVEDFLNGDGNLINKILNRLKELDNVKTSYPSDFIWNPRYSGFSSCKECGGNCGGCTGTCDGQCEDDCSGSCANINWSI